MQFLMLPLSFLSVTFMQKDLMPDWMQTAPRFNPVNWAVEAGREALTASPDWGRDRRLGGTAGRVPGRVPVLRGAGVPRLPALGVGPWVGGERAHTPRLPAGRVRCPAGGRLLQHRQPLAAHPSRSGGRRARAGAPQPTLDDRRRGLVHRRRAVARAVRAADRRRRRGRGAGGGHQLRPRIGGTQPDAPGRRSDPGARRRVPLRDLHLARPRPTRPAPRS